MNGNKAQILIDSGTMLNHVDTDFCLKHGIVIQDKNHVARMANNIEQEVSSTKDPIAVSFSSYSENMMMVVNSLIYDVVLGKKWGENHNVRLDFNFSTM